MKLQTSKLAHIKYEKLTKDDSVGEITERHIIPTFIPQPNIKAIDVTDMSEDERSYLEDAYSEYSAYVAAQMKNISTFENWLELTKQDSDTGANLKWRTFRTSNVELLQE